MTKTDQINLKRWSSARLISSNMGEIDWAVEKIRSNRSTYESVTLDFIPWIFVALVHMRESSFSFRGVLHNGEEIIGTGKKTSLVPSGRGPFASWQDAAADALKSHKFKSEHLSGSWTLLDLLDELERYNGLGYHYRGIASPYLWNMTTVGIGSGKFIADGRYDPNAVDRQVGCAAVLKRMIVSEKTLTDLDISAKIDEGETFISFGEKSSRIAELQKFLNELLNRSKMSDRLKVDGIAGPITSRTFHQYFGHYLKGDERETNGVSK